MVTLSIIFTLCHVTVATPDPLKDPVFSDCRKEVVLLNVPKDPVKARQKCFLAMQEASVATNGPVMARIMKTKKFPFTSKGMVVKEASCQPPVNPQTS